MNHIVTAIDATGTSTAKFDIVKFEVRLREHASTITDTKIAIQKSAAELYAAIDRLSKRGVLRLESGGLQVVQSTIAEHTKYRRDDLDGFAAHYHVAWKTTSVENAKAIYDALLELAASRKPPEKGHEWPVHVELPTFHLSEDQPIKDEALAIAWTRIQERIEKQCKMLNVDSNRLEIKGWQAGYEGYVRTVPVRVAGAPGPTGPTGPQGPTGATGAQGLTGSVLPLEIHPGYATVRVALRVDYGWR